MKMDYDEILVELGQFSQWHMVMILPLFATMGTAAFGILSYSFTGLQPNEFRCLIPDCNENLGNATVDDFGVDIFWKDGDDINYCYTRPLLSAGSQHCTPNSFDYTDNLQKEDFQLCQPSKDQKVIYGEFGMDSDAVTEFNLICDENYKVTLTATITMSALLVGSYIIGFISDKLGRKIALIISQVIIAVGLIMGAFMPEYISFTTARFITGLGSVGAMLIPFGMTIELVGTKYKTLFGLLYKVPFSLGEVIIGVLAIGVGDYVTFQWVLAIPIFVLTLLSIWVVPESPRWLIKKKKYAKAKKIIDNAATFNKIQISPHLLNIPDDHFKNEAEDEFNNNTNTDLGTKDLFVHPGSRKVLFIMMFIWIAVNLVFYGLIYSSTSLSSDVYLNFILNGLVEIPIVVICIFTMDHVGRKPLLVINMVLLTGVCCIPAGFASTSVKTALVLVGKMGASGAFAIIYVYTAEMYPTVVRGTALGLCSLAGRIGGVIAPLVALYLPDVSFEALPLLIFGCISIIGGIFAFWLPETLGSPLVESLDEIYILYKHSKPILKWWSTKEVNDNLEKINSLRQTPSNSRKTSKNL